MQTHQSRKLALAFVILVILAIPSTAQTFTLMHSFSGSGADGSNPYATLIQGFNGSLYGTTSAGGANGNGTVFSISTGGTLETVYSFCALTDCADGTDPRDSLLQAGNGNFYGVTFGGGVHDSPGTIFQLTESGTLTTLYTFCALSLCADGESPIGGMLQARNRALYGTTAAGGAHGGGTVFRYRIVGGAPTTLHNFCSMSSCTDGDSPQGTLIQGSDYSIYGTTYDGGSSVYYGNVFKVSPTGAFSSLHSFSGGDGDEPIGGLVQATDGNYYGTTQTDGAHGYGTVFKITSTGVFTKLYDFCALLFCADGGTPEAGLIQGSDGNLYGTTFTGGGGAGTVFSITTGGVLTTLHNFAGGSTDGREPWGGLVQDTNGTFYGTTYAGGASNLGTVYSLSVGLAPFVKVRFPAGESGEVVEILGDQLNGATSVTFDGLPAVINRKTDSEIDVVVPSGLTAGATVSVIVQTPTSTLKSYPGFRVIK
jgi:uncharacterized repeat protein (TIGR03803 family)